MEQIEEGHDDGADDDSDDALIYNIQSNGADQSQSPSHALGSTISHSLSLSGFSLVGVH